ncbi:MAG: T9SS type A sorting domain-containing protein [Bacteroidales bacterium]|nr:T9SS type A sorting domain-containing protein [Bacteroidales bacterium]
MKKMVLTIAGFLGCVLLLSGQITLTYKTHGFRPGDSHDFVFLTPASEGAEGANVVWDFSQLERTNRTLTSHMLDISSAPQAEGLSNANFALEEFGNYFYFNNNNKSMEQWATVSGNSILKYDKPIVKLKFPLNYGYKISGNYSGVQTCPSCSTTVSGTYEVFADAYGTIILPNQVVIDNVLRVKQTRTIQFGQGSSITEITYRWYSADVRYPVFVIIKYVTPQHSYTSETAMYAHAGTHKKSATAVEQTISNSTFEVFPNPFDNQVTLRIKLANTSKLTIELYDLSGKLIHSFYKHHRFTAGEQDLVLSTEKFRLQNSYYYLKISDGKQTWIEKVIKQ